MAGDPVAAKAVLDLVAKATAKPKTTAADRLRRRTCCVDQARFGRSDNPTPLTQVRAQLSNS